MTLSHSRLAAYFNTLKKNHQYHYNSTIQKKISAILRENVKIDIAVMHFDGNF
jgi:hypothetical protein